jgi:hypothetical protein
MAETIIGLYKTEVIHPRGPWRSLDAVEYATLERVDWFNNRRLLEPIGHILPTEFEQEYYRSKAGQATDCAAARCRAARQCRPLHRGGRQTGGGRGRVRPVSRPAPHPHRGLGGCGQHGFAVTTLVVARDRVEHRSRRAPGPTVHYSMDRPSRCQQMRPCGCSRSHQAVRDCG